MGDKGALTTTTSHRKREANRKNAQRSTGPRTAEGKAVSALNATHHGLLVVSPVVEALERAEEWEALRGGLVAALRPADALEDLLASRVALAAWRLGRVARYEREAVALLQEEALDCTAADEAGPVERAEGTADHYAVYAALPGMADADAFDPSWAVTILSDAAETVGADDFPRPEGCPATHEHQESWPGWTAGNVRASLAAMEKREGEEGILQHMIEWRRAERDKAQAQVGRLTTKVERKKRERILPNQDTIEKITRYEAHLERGLYRALHELWRIQAARSGGHVPAPAVLDVDAAVEPQQE